MSYANRLSRATLQRQAVELQRSIDEGHATPYGDTLKSQNLEFLAQMDRYKGSNSDEIKSAAYEEARKCHDSALSKSLSGMGAGAAAVVLGIAAPEILIPAALAAAVCWAGASFEANRDTRRGDDATAFARQVAVWEEVAEPPKAPPVHPSQWW